MKVVGVDVVRTSDRVVPRVGVGREGSWVTRQDRGGSGVFPLRFIPRMVQCTFTHVGAMLVCSTCDMFWHHGQQQLLTDISEL